MNSQVWLTNILLISAWGITLGYLYLMPFRVPLKAHLAAISKNTVEDISINKIPQVSSIYERDLFSAMPIIPEEEVIPRYTPKNLVSIPSFPQPPQAVNADDLVVPPPQFLPPLSLVLKGTILSSNPAHNRAFIENTKTKEEKSVKLGDMVEDAQIISIGKNKTIFIRSNGQEEIIYTNPLIAQEEIEVARGLPWQKIVFDNSVGEKIIDVGLLIKRTPTVGHFLEALDLIASFDGPVPIGCQVGLATNTSLIYALGLETSDIITHIDDISTATPEDRISIYQKLVTSATHDTLIAAKLRRKGNEITKTYRLFMPPLKTSSSSKSHGVLGISEEKIYRGNSYKERYAKHQVETSAHYARDIGQDVNKQNQENTWRGGKQHVLYRQAE